MNDGELELLDLSGLKPSSRHVVGVAEVSRHVWGTIYEKCMVSRLSLATHPLVSHVHSARTAVFSAGFTAYYFRSNVYQSCT